MTPGKKMVSLGPLLSSGVSGFQGPPGPAQPPPFSPGVGGGRRGRRNLPLSATPQWPLTGMQQPCNYLELVLFWGKKQQKVF